MKRPNLNDLASFVAVADAGSFTAAALHLGVSTSAISHTIRKLEADIGVRLLNRTTRRVAPTEAGDKLIAGFAPLLDQLDGHLESLAEMRDRPAGTLRISCDEHAMDTVLMPAIAEVTRAYPDIHIETVIDYGLTDIVAERFDAGVRLGGIIARDMIAVQIGPEMQSVIVGAPSYFEGRDKPLTPSDLLGHRCINLRLPTHGNIYGWELERNGREQVVNVEGPLTFNSIHPIYQAALLGLGLAYMTTDLVADDLRSGRLEQVLSDWTPPYAGYHIYYSNARQGKPAFQILLNALRSNRRRLETALRAQSPAS